MRRMARRPDLEIPTAEGFLCLSGDGRGLEIPSDEEGHRLARRDLIFIS